MRTALLLLALLALPVRTARPKLALPIRPDSEPLPPGGAAGRTPFLHPFPFDPPFRAPPLHAILFLPTRAPSFPAPNPCTPFMPPNSVSPPPPPACLYRRSVPITGSVPDGAVPDAVRPIGAAAGGYPRPGGDFFLAGVFRRWGGGSSAGCAFGGRFYALEETWHPDLGEPFGVMRCVICHCETVSAPPRPLLGEGTPPTPPPLEALLERGSPPFIQYPHPKGKGSGDSSSRPHTWVPPSSGGLKAHAPFSSLPSSESAPPPASSRGGAGGATHSWAGGWGPGFGCHTNSWGLRKVCGAQGLCRWAEVFGAVPGEHCYPPPCHPLELGIGIRCICGTIWHDLVRFSLPQQRNRRGKPVGKVNCKNMKQDCPVPTCPRATLLPGHCCHTCPKGERGAVTRCWAQPGTGDTGHPHGGAPWCRGYLCHNHLPTVPPMPALPGAPEKSYKPPFDTFEYFQDKEDELDKPYNDRSYLSSEGSARDDARTGEPRQGLQRRASLCSL